MSDILTLGINWVLTADYVPVAMVGEQFVCLVPARKNCGGHLCYCVEIITATETGWDNENGFSIEDSVVWCSAYDFHRSAERVFGPLESEAE